MENAKVFLVVKNTKVFQSGHFVMGLAHVKNAKIFQNGEKCEDFSKWSYCNGWPVQVENAKIFQNGEKCEWFFKVVENVNDLSVNSVSFLDLKNQ